MTSENAVAREWLAVPPEVLSGEALEPYEDGVGSPGFLETVKPHLPGQKKLTLYNGEIWVAMFEHCNGASHAPFFPGDEFVYVLGGTVTLPDDRTGEAPTFGPGEHFLVPKGWQGTWTSEGYYREIAVCPRDWLVPYTRTFADGAIDAERRNRVLAIDPAQARERLVETSGGWPRAAHIQGSDLLVRLVAGNGEHAARARFDAGDTFVQVLEGGIVLTGSDGSQESFGPGEFVIVPAGSTGSWDIAADFMGIAVSGGIRPA
jgi:uncharacterized cupin superfamily protein